jgi:hypothetical protein
MLGLWTGCCLTKFRLILQAAAGWPFSELLDRSIAEHFGVPSILDQTGRAPSLLNGGMDQVSPLWWGFCIGLTGAIESYGIAKARSGDQKYFPGKLGFVSFESIMLLCSWYRFLLCYSTNESLSVRL